MPTKKGTIFRCGTCDKDFVPNDYEAKYCSRSCGYKSFVGKTAWNKGLKTSEQTKEKLRSSHLGKEAWNKGKKTPIDVVEKLRVAHLGQKAWNKGLLTRTMTQAEYRRRHYLNNKAKYILQARKRKEQIKKENLDETADMEKISAFYKLAEKLTSQLGRLYVVDHVKPLSAGGKHHQDNLQVITATDNSRKGTKYPFEVSEVHLPIIQNNL